jgi:uncharacterized protein YraI
MRLDQRSSVVVLTIVVVGLAFGAGLMIPLASGGPKGSAAPPGWTPPPTASATVRPTLTRRPTIPTLAAATATATRQPTPTRPTATSTSRPTPTLAPATATPTVAPTAAPTARATATAAPTAAAGAAIAQVREGPLSLRTGPGRDQPLLAVAQIGETFTVTGRTADNLWLQVCCVRTNPAWAFAEYLTITGTLTSLPIKP